MDVLPQPRTPLTMVSLLSLIADDSVSVWVFEGEGRGKVVVPEYRGKIEKQEEG